MLERLREARKQFMENRLLVVRLIATLLIPCAAPAGLLVVHSGEGETFFIDDTYTSTHPGANVAVTWSAETDLGSVHELLNVILQGPSGQTIDLGTNLVNGVPRPGGCFDGIQDTYACWVGMAVSNSATLVTADQAAAFVSYGQFSAVVLNLSEDQLDLGNLTDPPFRLYFSDPSPDRSPASVPEPSSWLLMAGGIAAIALRLKGQQQSS